MNTKTFFLQGIFLAILYCFCNSEVQDTIKRHIRRILTRKEVRRSATLNTSRYNARGSFAVSGSGSGGTKSAALLYKRPEITEEIDADLEEGNGDINGSATTELKPLTASGEGPDPDQKRFSLNSAPPPKKPPRLWAGGKSGNGCVKTAV